jgi:fatty-acyl-CoA synthase
MDQPEATRKVFTEDGYFKTGDLGWCVSDRQFVFQARMGDSLRLAGFLVNPSEIEQVIESLPGISACQVVAANQGDKTVTVAFVTLTESATANPHDWYSACKRRLAGFKVPAHFEVLESFPTVESANSVKIQKHRLREMAQDILNDKQ